MTHRFRLDETTAATHTERAPDGGVLVIRCRAEDGDSTLLRLELTEEGIRRLADLVARFATHARPQADSDSRTPAAEPTSGGANVAQSRHVERYAVVPMTGTELANLLQALENVREKAHDPDLDWHDRVVVWRVPDAGATRPDDICYRVYISPGAVSIARRQQIRIEPVGEVFRTDLPADRELLAGDPPLDWQDTAL